LLDELEEIDSRVEKRRFEIAFKINIIFLSTMEVRTMNTYGPFERELTARYVEHIAKRRLE